jgi:hypothetical protein
MRTIPHIDECWSQLREYLPDFQRPT